MIVNQAPCVTGTASNSTQIILICIWNWAPEHTPIAWQNTWIWPLLIQPTMRQHKYLWWTSAQHLVTVVLFLIPQLGKIYPTILINRSGVNWQDSGFRIQEMFIQYNYIKFVYIYCTSFILSCWCSVTPVILPGGSLINFTRWYFSWH